MTPDDAADPLLDVLGSLARLTPDRRREARVRARCRTAIENCRNEIRRQDAVAHGSRLTAAGLALAAVSYAVAVAIAVLRLTLTVNRLSSGSRMYRSVVRSVHLQVGLGSLQSAAVAPGRPGWAPWKGQRAPDLARR